MRVKYNNNFLMIANDLNSDRDASNQNIMTTNENPITEDLIAPCGMNCAICSRYQAYVHNFRRSQCPGCRLKNEPCDYLFEKCTGINQRSNEDRVYCFKCDEFPCRQIKRMDKRYRDNYKMSVVENLECIRDQGLQQFIQEEYQRHRCSRCGGLVSIHNRKCFNCDTVTRLIEKD